MISDADGICGPNGGAQSLRLTAGDGCTVLKRKTVKLLQSFDNELVIFHMRAILNEAGFHRTDEFILAAAAVALVPALAGPGKFVGGLSKYLMVATLFVIGSNVSLDAVRKLGFAPLLHGIALWLILLTGWLVSILQNPGFGISGA